MTLRAAAVLAATFMLLSPLAAAEEVRQPPAFATFWPPFRAALLADDIATVASATRFPLEVRGELDSSPVRRITKDDLGPVLRRTLDADSGLSLRDTLTNRDMVKRVTDLGQATVGVTVRRDTARVGAFDFARGAKGWRLVRLYDSGP